MKKSYIQKLTTKISDGVMAYFAGTVLGELAPQSAASLEYNKEHLQRLVEDEVEYGLRLLEKRLNKSITPYKNFNKKMIKAFSKQGFIIKYNINTKEYEVEKKDGAALRKEIDSYLERNGREEQFI